MDTARSTLVNIPHGYNLPAVVTGDGENESRVFLFAQRLKIFPVLR